jgi:hypothetical protein
MNEILAPAEIAPSKIVFYPILFVPSWDKAGCNFPTSMEIRL